MTTYFDEHFSTVARQLYRKERVREYYAPALPLGDDFSGLVYLHGAARIDPRQLVLTDADLGEAYITRGWAREFLVSLFRHYSVLFVGYSHSDVTISYLARGLSRTEKALRWAMVPADIEPKDRENWDHLEIARIEYPLDSENKEHPHQPLTDFFTAWAQHTRESVFDKAKRIKKLARGLPSEREADSAYLLYCLKDPQLARDFCAAVRHLAWVRWLHDRGYFDAFFLDTASKPRVQFPHQWFSRWLTNEVRRRNPQLLFDLIRSHRQQLHGDFISALAHALWCDQSEKTDPHFATWLSVLLSQQTNAVDQSLWLYLLRECRLPEHTGVALRLFERLTTPEIALEHGWGRIPSAKEAGESNRPAQTIVDYSIRWPDESCYALREVWEKVFQPHLSLIAKPLAQILVKQLSSAYQLLRGVGKTARSYDSLSQSRSSIAPHEQDEIRSDDCLSCLINILRDILDHWLQTDVSSARTIAEDAWKTGFPLLMRFAVYARHHDPEFTADEQIAWVLQRDIVFQLGLKNEVFDLLKSAYRQSSHPVQEKLIRRIQQGTRQRGRKTQERSLDAYEKFNVLVWLSRSAPECGKVKVAIAEIQAKYPQFASWHSGAVSMDTTEGLDINQILSQPPEEFARELVHTDEQSFYPDRHDYMSCLTQLIQQDREWGRHLVVILSVESPTDTHLWNSVAFGWRESIKTESDWAWMLDLIEQLPHKRAIYEGIANLISHGFPTWKDDWEESLDERAAALMDRAWELCKGDPSPLDETYGNWLTTAINQVGGWIGEFWVHSCDRLRKRAGKLWVGLPESVQAKLKEALRGTNRPRVHARIALTPWIGFFFAWDRQFTLEHFLPLLDWDRDSIVAQQSWSVLLSYDRLKYKELEEQFLPFLKQTVKHVLPLLQQSTKNAEQFNRDTVHRLGVRLGCIAIDVLADPLETGFFRDFLPLLTEESRGSMAVGIEMALNRLNDEERQQLWDRWLRRYLEQRLVGIPVSLSTAETKYMLLWCLSLGPVFPEAVDLVVQMPLRGSGDVESYRVFHELIESPLTNAFPLAACRLAIAVMHADEHMTFRGTPEALHEKLKLAIATAPEFKTFEELLYRRGWRQP